MKRLAKMVREISPSAVLMVVGIVAAACGVSLTFGGVGVDASVDGQSITFNYEALAGILLLVGAAGPAFYWAGRWNQRLTHVEERLDSHLDRVISAADRIAASVESATAVLLSRKPDDD